MDDEKDPQQQPRCASCDSQLPAGAAFCPNCGALTALGNREADNPQTDRGNSQSGTRRSRRLLKPLILVGLLITAGVSATAFALSQESDGHTVSGTFSVTDPDMRRTGPQEGPCSTEGGYDDVQVGLRVVIKDGSGSILATGALGRGEWAPHRVSGVSYEKVCRFSFAVNDVPDSDFYTIEVGRRGELSYSKAELEALDWTVAFTLG